MLDTEKLEELMQGMNAQASPVPLINHNYPAERIIEMDVIEVHPCPPKAREELNRKLNHGFKIAQLLVLRQDHIIYGNAGVSAVSHIMVAVIVRLSDA